MSGVPENPAQPTGDEPVNVAAIQAELAEAKRIGTWLYDHLPWAVRHVLGDVSEWPWLLDGANARAADALPAVTDKDPVRDLAVLRAFAALQESGEDVYFAAEHVAATLDLTANELDAALANLIADGHLHGGKTFTRAFVESVTDAGLAAAGAAGP